MPVTTCPRKCDRLEDDNTSKALYIGGMWEQYFLDAALLPAIMVALVAGMISFLSPCVLPIVPPYLAYMAGVSFEEMSDTLRGRRKAVIAACFFVLGLSCVFVLLGLASSYFGRLFLQGQDWFIFVAGIVVMIFGAHFIGVFRIGFLDRELRMQGAGKGGSAFGAFVLGLAFAFGWTPCLGPFLSLILSLAADQEEPAKGMILLGIYAAGMGIPFILVAAFFTSLHGVMSWLKTHAERIEKIMGLLLWTVGLMMITGHFTLFSWWLLEQFPLLGEVG